jgi:hypothetical protein
MLLYVPVATHGHSPSYSIIYIMVFDKLAKIYVFFKIKVL